MSLLFYTIYISSALVGMGHLLETLFDINYYLGTLIGILIVIPYLFVGGYITLAWIDLFQGFFLMAVIIFVPLFVLPGIGGWEGIVDSVSMHNLSLALIPDFSASTLFEIFFMAFGWGLGYFGQPHIITKFMGIKNVHEISKSKFIGMGWMIISLAAATFVGLTGIAFFKNGLADPQQVFIEMVKVSFHPFFIGLMLCAVLATTINAMSSQVLVLSSSLTEDFYKRLFKKDASSKELLLVTRLGILLVSLIALGIAYAKLSTVFTLVFYAWSGLGSSFGPLLILSLYSKKINKYGAWAGILSGGLISATWPYFNSFISVQIPSMILGFSISFILILLVSHLTRDSKNQSVKRYNSSR
jgi:sodium/proline symporter